MESTVEQDRIIEMIRRLLGLATSNNVHEATLAAAKAQELLFKYNLDIAQIEELGGPQAQEYISEFIELSNTKQYISWKRGLLHIIAKYNFCRTVSYTNSVQCMIVGKRHNIEVVQYLYSYLAGEVARLAENGYKNNNRKGWVQKPTWINSFCSGAVSGIYQQLRAQRVQDLGLSSSSTAMVVTTDRELDNALDQFMPNRRTGRSYQVSDISARNIGYKKGLEIPINDAVPSGNKQLQLT